MGWDSHKLPWDSIGPTEKVLLGQACQLYNHRFVTSHVFQKWKFDQVHCKNSHWQLGASVSRQQQGRIQGGAIGAIAPPKTYESNIFHNDFVQFRKKRSCKRRLDCQILLKSPPLNLRAGSASRQHKKVATVIRPWATQKLRHAILRQIRSTRRSYKYSSYIRSFEVTTTVFPDNKTWRNFWGWF